MDSKNKILDIAMNLNRIGNWAADNYVAKKERIKTFLDNTSEYIQDLNKTSFPPRFEKIFKKFKAEYPKLEKNGLKGPKKSLEWAEDMMTWGNILTHRSKFL